VAYAIPRNAPSGSVEIVLPEPLPPSAVAQYQRILSLQATGHYAAADRLIARLDDDSLVGPVLAARYLSPRYRATPAQLLGWYARYSAQPEAADIFALMQAVVPRADMPGAPAIALLPEAAAATALPPTAPADNPVWRARFLRALAAWQRGDIAGAGAIFTATAAMPDISADSRATSDFWAARAALRNMQPDDYLNWLHEAAAAPDTFYGMLAGRLLGEGFGPTAITASLTEADITAVDAQPNGHLAFALLQIGQDEAAATALRALWPEIQASPDFGQSVMAVAARAGLADVTIAVAGTLPGGTAIAGTRLPLPPLHPAGGFTIDPALVYALARTESGFNPAAVSRAGAQGLMQLMPVTAHYIARESGLTGALATPSANLALGQAYVKYLGDQAGIDGNLLAILASYNAGPNAAQAWYGALQVDSDPLIFIESIPNNETRHFVHQVLADSWLYAEEIGLKPKSLDDLAEGNFPQLDATFAAAH
jgi:soluble lytic murein transglycosylase-like protein